MGSVERAHSVSWIRYLTLPLIIFVLGAAPPKAEAGRLVERGNKHFDAGRYKLAIRAYERALEKYPSPRILVNLAEAQWRIGHWGAALVNFRKFIDEGDARPGSKIYKSISARME